MHVRGAVTPHVRLLYHENASRHRDVLVTARMRRRDVTTSRGSNGATLRAMTAASKTIENVLASALAASPVGPLLRVAILFGSAASGPLHSASDIDVAILPLAPDLALRHELELQADLERLCGRAVDIVRLDLANTLLRWEIARGGRVLLESPVGAGARFQAQAALEHADFAPLFEAGAERWRRAVLARARLPA